VVVVVVVVVVEWWSWSWAGMALSWPVCPARPSVSLPFPPAPQPKLIPLPCCLGLPYLSFRARASLSQFTHHHSTHARYHSGLVHLTFFFYSHCYPCTSTATPDRTGQSTGYTQRDTFSLPQIPSSQHTTSPPFVGTTQRRHISNSGIVDICLFCPGRLAHNLPYPPLA
jgi:hypothetical protein